MQLHINTENGNRPYKGFAVMRMVNNDEHQTYFNMKSAKFASTCHGSIGFEGRKIGQGTRQRASLGNHHQIVTSREEIGTLRECTVLLTIRREV